MGVSIARRWPIDLLPSSCQFGRDRSSDVLFQSPTSRVEHTISRGRPLWTAQITWQRFQTDWSRMMDLVEGLSGYKGSVMIWDFSRPKPKGSGLAASDPVGAAGVGLIPFSGSVPWNDGLGQSVFWGVDYGRTEISSYHAAGSDQISLTGLKASQTILMPGDYIQIGRRLYVCQSALVSDSSGNGTVKLRTGLVTEARVFTEVRLQYCAVEMRLKTPNWNYQGQANDPFRPVTLEFIETGEDY